MRAGLDERGGGAGERAGDGDLVPRQDVEPGAAGAGGGDSHAGTDAGVSGGGAYGAEGGAVGDGEEPVIPVFAVVSLGSGSGLRCGEAESQSQLLRSRVGAPDGPDGDSGDTDTGDAPEGRHGQRARRRDGEAGWVVGGVGMETLPNKHRKSRKATVVADGYSHFGCESDVGEAFMVV